MQLIAKQTVGAGGAASVTFDNIPNTYTDLKLVMSARATRTGSDISTSAGVTFNRDSGSYYSDKMIEGGYGSTRSASDSSTRFERFDMPTDDTTSNTFSNNEMYIPNYTSTNPKSVSYESIVENNSTANYMYLAGGLYSPPTNIAITTITLTALYSSTFQEFSTFYLYGISNSTTTQATTVPYASGGDVITTDGTYWYHTFLYSGTFTPLKNLTCDYLVVAGGGAGGTGAAGGGAGGFRTSIGGTPLSLTAQAYTATVGAGGSRGSSQSNPPSGNATSGTNSIFSTITSTGGGFGGSYSGIAGGNGGSGGGGNDSGFGTGISGQGNNGGTGGFVQGGGGGGAGAVGGNSGGGNGGNGGNGLASSITGSSVTYAGGGGGGSWANQGSAGSGGTGGGGAGTNNNATATSGTTNTGSGGGSGGFTQSNPNFGLGGNGGSGIVIIRYAV